MQAQTSAGVDRGTRRAILAIVSTSRARQKTCVSGWDQVAATRQRRTLRVEMGSVSIVLSWLLNRFEDLPGRSPGS